MAVMAQWLNKYFGITSKQLATLQGFSTSKEVQSETKTDTQSGSSTTVWGFKPQEFSISLKVSRAGGFRDVRAEYESWEALVGVYAPFYLSGRRWGSGRFILMSVSSGEPIMDNGGVWLEATITMRFQEYTEGGAAQGAVTGPGVYQAVGISTATAVANAATAVDVTASAEDKATLKPIYL